MRELSGIGFLGRRPLVPVGAGVVMGRVGTLVVARVPLDGRTTGDHKGWSEPIFPDTGGSQLPVQSGQGKCTATLADVKPSCSYLAMRLTSASLRGSVFLDLIENQKTAGFC